MTGHIEASANVITAIAAGVGAAVAFVGLRTWKHQLRKNLDLELGRRTLRAALEVRNAIFGFRHPFGHGGPPEKPVESGDQPASRLSPDHQRRWDRLRTKLIDLDAAVVEAEVAWGENAVEAVRPTWGVVKDLDLALMTYYDIKEAGTIANAGLSHEKATKARRIVFGIGDEFDEFHKTVVGAVKVLESYLRPKIRI